MEKIPINIQKIETIENLYYAGYSLNHLKGKEVVLETNNLDMAPLRLKVTFATLCEGILNSDPKITNESKTNIDYQYIDIPDIATLVQELSKYTGLKFSIALTSPN